jgi:hypothetical protein
VHDDHTYVGIPDLSAAHDGKDYWLELKYGEFGMAEGPEGRDYDTFEFSEVTRQQLEWLRIRELAGGARCGILGYFRVRPSYLTHYVFFMPPQRYLDKVWRNNDSFSVGAAILSPWCENASVIHGVIGLTNFMSDACRGRRSQRTELG